MKKRDCAIYSVVKEPLHRSLGANCHVLHSIARLPAEPLSQELRLISILPAHGISGAERDRTADPLLAKQVLSQLSYSPEFIGLVGLPGVEPGTSRLSGVCSNQLSYRPISGHGTARERMDHQRRLRRPTCLRTLNRMSGAKRDRPETGVTPVAEATPSRTSPERR